MSSDAISEFKNYLPALAELKTKNYEQLTKERDRRQVEWNDTLLNLESGTVNKWYLPETDDNDWTKIYVPAVWQSVGIKGNGVGWFRKEFDLNEKEASNNVLFFLGIIHNAEETYLNGVKIGKSDDYNRPRIYAATPSILRKGKNVLAVKVYNYWGDGGFISKAEDLYYQTKTENKPLSGPWKFKIGYFSPNPDVVINRNNYPTLLYNTMVNPLVRFPIKGVLWYQGENNVGKAVEYRNLLPAMIMDWRKQWNIGDFPFLIVQLTNIQKSDDFPVESVWAQLREAQASSLTLSNTGLAVTIDIGEADNIHAKNKQDVGYRLSLAARKIAYGEDIIYSGPTLKSFKMEGNKAIIEFDNIGSGLVSNDKYGYVKGFSIAGPDHKFYWAKAEIKDNKVMVSSEKVNSPVAIRYAWGNNPDASLYNIEKLPCVPFRTDNW
jgi:sialate O-acetylesterase